MIDFSYTSPSLGISLYCTILFIIIISIGYKQCVNLKYQNQQNKLFSFLVFVFVVTCSVVGDFYHYQQLVWNYDFTPGARNHGEPIYKYIIGLVDRNYLLFRILIWGGGLLAFSKIVRRIGFNLSNVLFVFVALYILVYSYARASLAMVLYFWGITIFIINKKNVFLEKILGIFLICFSYSFHHSIIIAIALTPVIFMKLTKRHLVILIVILPLLFFYSKGYIQQMMFDESTLNNDDLQEKLELYSNREVAIVNWKGLIYEFSGYLTFFIPFIVCLNSLYFKNKIIAPEIIQAFFKLSLAMILLAIMFLFLDIQGKVFFYRILYMTFIPISIMLYYVYNAGMIKKKTFCFIIILGITAQLYRLFYSIYTCI